jgi:hypothetical protein
MLTPALQHQRVADYCMSVPRRAEEQKTELAVGGRLSAVSE